MPPPDPGGDNARVLTDSLKFIPVLHRDRPAESVDLPAPASPYERSYLEPVYLRGMGYLRLRKGAQAVAEFQKIVDHKGANWGLYLDTPVFGGILLPSYLGMARGYAYMGETVKARKAFQDFFELWKDADPNIPYFSELKRSTPSCGERTDLRSSVVSLTEH